MTAVFCVAGNRDGAESCSDSAFRLAGQREDVSPAAHSGGNRWESVEPPASWKSFHQRGFAAENI